MNDDTPRFIKVGDAVSQLLNVLLLPRHKDTDANESISGRSYRCGWDRARKVIDFVFSPFEKDHCRKAFESDVLRAEKLLATKNTRK